MEALVTLVPDTNIFLHYQPLDQIPWPKLANATTVDIVLVSQVLRELDDKKNGESPRLRQRAQRALAQIDAWLPPGALVASIADSARLRVRVQEPQQIIGLDFAVGDDRIVAAAMELRTEASTPTIVVTGDVGMRFKAEARGLTIMRLPEQYRVRDDEQKKEAQAPRYIARLRPGALDPQRDVLELNAFLSVGLSAQHLLNDALLALERARDSSNSFRGMRDLYTVGLADNGEPSVAAYERYVSDIREYDKRHAAILEMRVGVVNEGDGPADDITAQFFFPHGMYVTDHGFALPEAPRRRSYIDSLMSQSILQPHPMKMTEFRELVEVGEGRAMARIRLTRLMQSERRTYRLWVAIAEGATTGFSIECKVLAAEPVITITSTINVRFADR
jgi:hypothetical protein